MSLLNISNGLFRPAPNTQAIATGNEERLRITSNGDIGIGTLAPTERLDVTGGIRVGFSSNNNAGTIRWSGSAMEYNDGTSWLPFSSGGSGGSLWSQSGSDVFYNLGNVGIGTITPTNALQVSFGDVRVGEISPAGGTGGSGEGRRLYFSGGPAYSTRDSENSDPLWIARYNDSEDVTRLRINVGDNPDSDDGLEIGFRNASSGPWVSNFFFGADGNFGIQTDTPTELLDVNGQARVRVLPATSTLDNLVVVDSTGVLHRRDVSSLGGGSQWIPVPTAPSDIYFNTGNVGVGTTSPQTTLHVDDGAVLFTGSGSSTPPILGGGTRFMYLPGNGGAFRTGTVNNNEWNSIGDFSIGMGQDTIATGKGAVAIGNTAHATSENTTAIGLNSTATRIDASAFHGGSAQADQSLVIGISSQTSASGINSYIIGNNSVGEGPDSYVFGNNLQSQATGAFVIGSGDYQNTNPLINTEPDSLMIGFLSTIPTLFISPSVGPNATGTVAIANSNPSKDYTLDIEGNTRMRNLHCYARHNIILNNANSALPIKTNIDQTDMLTSHIHAEMSISGDITISDGLYDGQVLILICTVNSRGSSRVDLEGNNIVETRRIALNSRPYFTYMMWSETMRQSQTSQFGVWMYI